MWDLSTVLKAMKGAPFEPIHLLDMKHPSYKTVFHMALASVKRIGDLHVLSVSATCMEFGPNDLKVIRKTSEKSQFFSLLRNLPLGRGSIRVIESW